MAVVELTKENFEQVVTSNPTVIVDYWAPWCGPCRGFAPVFEKVAEANPDVVFAKVNTDEQQQLAQFFGIQTIPTLSLVHRQREVARSIGVLYHADLRRWIWGALSEPEGTSVKG